jgi:hypothetical protein
MSASDLQFCQGFLDCERTGDCDAFEQADRLSFDECESLISGGGSGRGVFASLKVFSSWSTLIIIGLALLLPLLFVAIYTNFTFQWRKAEDE